jgi:hypothetical protein
MLLLAHSRRLDSRHRHSGRSSRPRPVVGWIVRQQQQQQRLGRQQQLLA